MGAAAGRCVRGRQQGVPAALAAVPGVPATAARHLARPLAVADWPASYLGDTVSGSAYRAMPFKYSL